MCVGETQGQRLRRQVEQISVRLHPSFLVPLFVGGGPDPVFLRTGVGDPTRHS